MNARNILMLLGLSIAWGAAFLFLRVAAPEFGAFALIEVRVALAAVVLLPFLLQSRNAAEILRNWKPILLMGILHYAIPFCLFAYAALTLTSGYTAIINASSPLFAGLIAWIWLGERLEQGRVIGLFIGVAGVALLVWEKVAPQSVSLILPVCAAVAASLCYAVAAVLAKKQLAGVPPNAVASGSMVVAAIVLLPASAWFWPEVSPSQTAWSMAVALGIICTAVAFVVYFQLIARIGPTNAITVTFLAPFFASLFGAWFLNEQLTVSMVVGGATVLAGTTLSTGLVLLPRFLRRQPISR